MKPTTMAIGMGIPSTIPSPFSIEIETHVFKRVSEIADREQIPLKLLASELLKHMLLFEKSEVNKIITQLRRNHHCPDP